ncbi:MAG: type II toxin-antitoxin system VapB family antitoxin [Candidatus Helarchaeota archaeon]
MQSVISIRIPKELRERMKRFDVNWKEILIKAIEEKIKEIEAQRILAEIEKINKDLEVSKIPSWKIIREDRDAGY